jgi:beta-glucosidase
MKANSLASSTGSYALKHSLGFFILLVFVFLSQLPGTAHARGIQANAKAENEITKLIAKLTLAEKVSLLGGTGFDTQPIARLGIPAIQMTDGPLGVRQGQMTAFPSGISMGASFDPALVRSVAKAIAEEARFAGKNMLLGPCVNISRHPFGGRNFESFGEDPFLTATLAAQYVEGIQSQDVLASVKHFALNDQEYERTTVDVDADPRAMFEIYFPPFKAAIDAGTWTVMSSYNKVKGDWSSENDVLLNQILKGLWGFKGFVVSDWDSTHSVAKAANAGLDLEMPTGEHFNSQLVAAVERGEVKLSVIDDKVRRILRAMYGIGLMGAGVHERSARLGTPLGPRSPEHRAVALKLAQASIVLLKNEAHVLPLSTTGANQIKSLAVIGPNAQLARTGGGGSSHVDPFFAISPLQGLTERLPKQIAIHYAMGQEVEGQVTQQAAINEAVRAAQNSDVAIIFSGLSDDEEGEGNDRKTMDLPAGQKELIEAVVAVNPKTVVVLTSGNPLSMTDWLGKVPGVLQMWYAGSEGGYAIADILMGRVNPSAKLPVTFLKRWEDSAAFGNYPGVGGQVHYAESIFVGYRHFDKESLEPNFEFGFGLSYTEFKYSHLDVELLPKAARPARVRVQFDVQNTGARAGAEIAQVYVGENQPSVPRPPRELKGFKKVNLLAGETKHVVIDLDDSSFAFFDVAKMAFRVNAGLFAVDVGSSSRALGLHTEVQIH